MSRPLLLICALLAAVVTGVAGGDEPQPGAAPGVYVVRGDSEELLCPLDTVALLPLPAAGEGGERAVVPAGVVELRVVVGEAATAAGVRADQLRLVRVTEAEPRPSMSVVAVAPVADPGARDAFRLTTAPLTAGHYELALELPGWTAGMARNQWVMRFLGCAVTVVDSPDREAGETPPESDGDSTP